MTNIDALIRQGLDFDPIAEAEKLTGQPCSGAFDTTSLVGLELMGIKRAALDESLSATDDTTFSNKLDNYQRIIGEEGFEKMLTIPFVNARWNERGNTAETYYIYFHPRDAILLSFDTFGGDQVNGGKFYYNWSPSKFTEAGTPDFDRRITSSGHYTVANADQRKYIWCGDHDCREALRFNIRQLRLNGTFLNPWFEPQSLLWLLHHGDTYELEKMDKSLDQLVSERIAMLPAPTRKAIAAKDANVSV